MKQQDPKESNLSFNGFLPMLNLHRIYKLLDNCHSQIIEVNARK